MPDQFGEKQHEPTQHRRDQARQRGQVARSSDLSSALLLLAGLTALWLWFAELFHRLAELTVGHLSQPRLKLDAPGALAWWQETWASSPRSWPR